MLFRSICFVLLVIAAVACRPSRVVTPPQVLEGTYIYGARLPLRDGPGGKIIATSSCGPKAILARDGQSIRVRAFYDDGTFIGEGIVDDADVARARLDPINRQACSGSPVVLRSSSIPERASLALIPPGFTRVDPSASWSGEGEMFHGEDCAKSTGDGTTVHESDDLLEPSPRHVERTWGLSFDDDHRAFNLTGPDEVVTLPGQPPIRQGWLCLRSFQIVGKHEGALVLLRGSSPKSDGVVIGYVPTDAELWYPSKAACHRDHPPPPPQLAFELALAHGCS